MATTLWVLVWVLVGLLAACTIYAAAVGLAGVFAGGRYEQCPRCHHHYLTGRGQPGHQCPHGIEERAYQAGWAVLHHPHSQAGAGHPSGLSSGPGTGARGGRANVGRRRSG